MALTTYKTYLMYKASAAAEYTKLVDIKNVPAIGAERNTVDVTSLTDDMEQLIPGIKRVGDGLVFNANYDQATYYTLDQLGIENEYDFAVWKGGTGEGTNATPTGADGKWSFKGKLAVGIADGDVDSAFNMSITIYPTTSVAFARGTTT